LLVCEYVVDVRHHESVVLDTKNGNV